MTNGQSNQEWQSSGTPGQAPPPAPGAAPPPAPPAGAAPQYAYPPQQPGVSPMDALQQFAQPKFIFIGIAFGALIYFVGCLIVIFNDPITNAGMTNLGSATQSFGRLALFLSAIAGGLLIKNQNHYTRLGYLILAAMTFSA